MGRKNTVLFVPIFVALIGSGVWAEKHVVGGSQGWEASTDFASWTSSKTFKVGDQLVFKYSSGLHSVVEMPNESAYESCDTGTVLDSKSSGNDVVKLNNPGTRYFACATLGHCDQGMKLKIKVVAGSAPSSPAKTSTPSPTSAYASSASDSQSFASVFVIVAATLLFSFSLSEILRGQ